MRAPLAFVGPTLLVTLAALASDACSPSSGGGVASDAGDDAAGDADGGHDASFDASDATPDASGDSSVDSGSDGGVDSGTDGAPDSGSDGGVDSGTDGGTLGGLYAGDVLDFAVDATNLYLLLPPSTIGSCPLAGCAAAGPMPLRTNTRSSEIEAGNGVVYFGYRYQGSVFMGQIAADGSGFSESLVLFAGGPYSLTFKTLRTDGYYLYGSVKQVGLGQTKLLPVSRSVAGGAGQQHHLQGGPIFDVRGPLEIEYFPGDSLVGEKFTSYDRGTATLATYPIPATKPASVAVHPALAVMLDAAGGPAFCPRVGCAAWITIPLVANAILMDSTHLFMGSDAGVYRCSITNMVSGACLPELVGATSAAVAQLVLGSGAVYARTTAPGIERVPLP